MTLTSPDSTTITPYPVYETRKTPSQQSPDQIVNLSITNLPVATITNSTVKEHLYTDHLASVIQTTGSTTTSSDYSPFGVSQSSSSQTRLGYIGEESDTTGLSYLNARYYNPTLGRFISQDPVSRDNPEKLLGDPQQLNYYSYAGNSPISASDRSGLVKDTFPYLEPIDYYNRFNDSVEIIGILAPLLLDVPVAASGSLGEVSAVSVVKNSAKVSRSAQLTVNRMGGVAFENKVAELLSDMGEIDISKQVHVRTVSGQKNILDIVASKNGTITCLIECKSSVTAPLTGGQKIGFPQISETGATVTSRTIPGLPYGTKIEAQPISIIRPANLVKEAKRISRTTSKVR